MPRCYVSVPEPRSVHGPHARHVARTTAARPPLSAPVAARARLCAGGGRSGSGDPLGRRRAGRCRPGPGRGSGAEPCGPHPVGPLLGPGRRRWGAQLGGGLGWSVHGARPAGPVVRSASHLARVVLRPHHNGVTARPAADRCGRGVRLRRWSRAAVGLCRTERAGRIRPPVLDQPPAWTSPPGCTPGGRRDRGVVGAPDPRPVAGLHRSVGGHLDVGGGCPVRGAGDQDLPRRDRRESALRGTVRGRGRTRPAPGPGSSVVELSDRPAGVAGSRGVGVVGRPDDPVGGAERRPTAGRGLVRAHRHPRDRGPRRSVLPAAAGGRFR